MNDGDKKNYLQLQWIQGGDITAQFKGEKYTIYKRVKLAYINILA